MSAILLLVLRSAAVNILAQQVKRLVAYIAARVKALVAKLRARHTTTPPEK